MIIYRYLKISILALIILLYVSCKSATNKQELKELFSAMQTRTLKLEEIHKGSKAYLLKVEDSLTGRQLFLTSPRAIFFTSNGIYAPN